MLWIALAQFIGGAVVALWAADQCTKLDVATGRREAMALIDDYGSNRGWYWPWTPLVQIGFVAALTAPITAMVVQ